MSAREDSLKGNSSREPIAVVGTGVRLPGSSHNTSALWDLVLKPRDLLTRIPNNRFNPDAFYHPDPDHHGTSNIQASYFLDQDVRHFDANFFNIKPVEAHAIDPQQRLLLEVVYESLDAAGMSIQAMAGSRTGVYVGLMCSDYTDHLHRDVQSMPTYTATGVSPSIMSNRISYFFDWHGPSMTIDTACSSSLVAVHQAVQSLRSGDADVAVAAGANLLLGPLQFVRWTKLHMLSADSRCRMWDADASGYARGEGVAAVVLKRLSTAIADGDHIECVIRESGVNQDGRTKGITMPSSTAQADLIERVYSRAGLDPKDPDQRCQYFEAHGTGTAAGDPREAAAISSSFFQPDEVVADQGHLPLYVGSIKTIVGHSEGAAGLAGLIKTSLALQHGIIPPNYLFNQLSPAVEPFYANLEVPKSPRPWPQLPESTPRRASVNSFGFGGTNAHVLLESFVPPSVESGSSSSQEQPTSPSRPLTPCNFSAASEKSLRGVLADYRAHFLRYPDIVLQDLSYTLSARRSEHAVRVSISARSTADLAAKLGLLLESGDGNTPIGVRAKAPSQPVRILGVFTGQGAQWPRMGKELVKSIPRVRSMIAELDAVLQDLPPADRPTWSLLDELLLDASSSRIATAMVGQPLCTVIQLVLCDLLTSAGVKFDAVVGHSGGEVAAAYAAGFIRRDDALKIAYYRGLITDRNPPDTPGGMLAAGMSVQEAYELCSSPVFKGRLEVAAINSSSSVTIAGDLDAIDQAKDVLDAEKQFARVLKVDKAYHSRHMVPSGKEYAEALERAQIQPQRPPPDSPVWHSSVFENRVMGADPDLSAQYWTDNMVRPVLFSHAIACATQASTFDVAIEVGPHPALKGPASQTLASGLPYTGVLARGKDDVEAFSDGLGYVWSHFSPSPINFAGYDALASGPTTRSLVLGLPTYHWDHETLFWHRSRASKAFLQPRSMPNPLLGSRMPDVMDEEIRWRNSLRLSELPWIRGHILQGQILYPASAYLATAIEATLHLVPQPAEIVMVEVRDLVITKPLVFKEDENGGIETISTLSNVVHHGDGSHSASFTYYACSSSSDTDALSTHATGEVFVVTSKESPSASLPRIPIEPPNTRSVSEDRFYKSLESLGFGFSGPFRTVSSAKRKLNFASAKIWSPLPDGMPEPMLLHPAFLESALQGLLLAYCCPDDGSLEQLHVPTEIKNFRVDIPLCRQQLLVPENEVSIRAQLTESPPAAGINGDVDMYSADGAGLAQFEGVCVVALAEPTPDADQPMFSEHRWGVADPDAELAMAGARATAEDYEFAQAVERICIHYMKETVDRFPAAVRRTLNWPWHFSCLFDFFQDVLDTTRAGTRSSSDPAWLDDTDADIEALKAKWGDRVDVRLAAAVGDNLSSVLLGESTMLEHMVKDNLLDRFYVDGIGLKEYSMHLARTVKQLVHCHPRMDILEIGAGTGGATKLIMKDIGRAFSSYTYTDISTGFFETARQVFASCADKMVFRTLNVENDVAEQGFEEHSYDLVVASLVLHATVDLNRTLSNARRLLKPGGYLIMTEVSNNDVSRVGFMMCAMPGWWLGQNEGRTLSPCISTSQWHHLLLRNGFDGVNSCTSDVDATTFPFAVIVSQAVDDRVELLQNSLAPRSMQAVVDAESSVVLIGGRTAATIPLIGNIARLLQGACIQHVVFKTLDDVDSSQLPDKSAILSLAELDEPIFKRLSPWSLRGLQTLVNSHQTMLWVTQGCKSENPYMNMTVGLGRSVVAENEGLGLQFLDFEVGVEPDPQQLLKALFRLYHGDMLAKDGTLSTILWNNEHELAYEGDRLLVSRVYPSDNLNDRFQASRRAMHRTINPDTTPVDLSYKLESKYSLTLNSTIAAAMDDYSASATEENNVCLKVSHSLLVPASAKRPSSSSLVIGTNRTTNVTKVAMSTNNGSYCIVPDSMALTVSELSEDKHPQLLTQLQAQLQVEAVMAICPKGCVLLIHEPSSETASGIAECAAHVNMAAFFTTSASTPPTNDKSWIQIDPYSPERFIRSRLPLDVSVFIDCSTGGPSKRIGSSIASILSSSCPLAAVFDIQSIGKGRAFSAAQLRTACSKALRLCSEPSNSRPRLIRLNELVSQSTVDDTCPTVVDWGASTEASVSISAVEDQIRFRSDRTYALFGLTSEMARSICDWMVSRGARNIVLTSGHDSTIDIRSMNPAAESSSSSLRIQEFSHDFTDKEALSTLVDSLRQDWPPIAGIAYGGAVTEVNDLAFSDMTLDSVNKVLHPKVKGATHLDELFQSNHPLEFFVLLSSVTAITGHQGQSIDSAANAFLSALARQRRDKGLAASVLHLGAVMGLGDDTCEPSTTGYLTISERAFHVCVGEAILASRPRSGRDPEVITALEAVRVGDDDGVTTPPSPPWCKLPRFQHCLRTDERGAKEEVAVEGQLTVVSTKSRLREAHTPEEIRDIVSGAFFVKLQSSLQLPPDHDRSRVLASGTDDLGVDSLVAVELSTWFAREVEADVPVFRILAGGSIAQLVEDAVELIPARLTPAVSSGSSEHDAQSVPDGGAGEEVTTSVPTSTVASQQGDKKDDASDTPASSVVNSDGSEKSFGPVIFSEVSATDLIG